MADPNFYNRTLYHGDNLDFLRGMNSGTVHLIATDPPFNKSKDFHATPDSLAAGASFQDRWSWRDDIHDDWLMQIQRNEPEVWSVITTAKNVYGDDMAAFLCWLGVRLLEMHRILREDGSIYLHIDHTAHAWGKCLMDAIFGRRNFRNEIVWQRTNAHGDTTQGATHFGRVHDLILRYSKGPSVTWNTQYIDYDPDYAKNFYRMVESETGRRFQAVDLTAQKPGGDTSYEWKGVRPYTGRFWAYSKAKMEEFDRQGRLYYTRTGRPRLKYYLDEMPGKPVQDIWDDISHALGAQRTGYPTQKPLALYERIIAASSNPGDWVLDPFCGCATTPVAAEKLGRQWVGMDIWDGAHTIVLQRMEDNRQLLAEPDPQIYYKTTPPVRTDTGEEAVLYLRTPTGRAPRYPAPRTQHYKLLTDIGAYCQGCGRDYSFDPRVLEVDHIRPKSDGGSDAYDNLTLLCPPCNKEKRDHMTLTGLQAENRKNGHLLEANEKNLRHGRAQAPGRRQRVRR